MKTFFAIITLLLTLSVVSVPRGPKRNLPKSFQKAGKLKPKFNTAAKKGVTKNKFNTSTQKKVKTAFNKASNKGVTKAKFNRLSKRKGLRQKFNSKSKRGYTKTNSKKNVRLNRLNKKAKKFNLNSKKGYTRARFNKKSRHNNISSILNRSKRQVQAKYKHAKDFGVKGNWNKKNAMKFSAAVHKHINGKTTEKISGTYQGKPVIHYFNQSNGLNVISTKSGKFVSGWKLSDKQIMNINSTGSL